VKLFLTLFILISCFNGIASADSIQIRCPSLNTLPFTENTNHNGWNHYQVLGYAQVLSGNIPAFVMEGNADNKGVSEMNWATYSAPDHALICLYSDASHSDFALNEVAEQKRTSRLPLQ